MIRSRSLPVLSLLLAAMTSGSASAINLTAADVVDSGGSMAGPRVTAACKLEAPILETNGIRFLVSGSATSSSTGTPVPLATHVHCVVRTNFGSYGGPSGDLPGPTAAAAGPSNTVPFDRLGGLRVCAYGVGFFQGGVTRTSIPSPGC